MTVKAIPDGYACGIPYLTIQDTARAIDFYKQAFGAVELMRMPRPDGKIMHAEIRIGEAPIMMGEEAVEWGALSPTTIGNTPTTIVLYVPDVDAAIARAVEAGATLTMPVANQFWGDRSGGLSDPFGHKWMLSTHIEDVGPEEMHRRMVAMFAEQPGNGCG